MTGFSRAPEDRPTPPEVYNWKVYAASLVISMGVLTYGYDSAFIGTTITQKSFVRDFGLVEMSKSEQNAVSSNLTSIYSAGGFFGALFMFFSLELLGRRMTVIMSDAIFIFGAFESFYQTGAVIGFWINYGIVHNIDTDNSIAWRIPMAVQLIPAGLLALMIPVLKESPTCERAVLAGGKPNFASFLKGAARESFTEGIRNRFALVFLMFMWQAWSGAATINYYSPTIFTSIGLTDATLWTGIYGVIRAGGSIIFYTWFIDAFGRKWPWIVSSLSCALCQYYLAGYIAIAKPKTGVPQSPSTIAGGKGATASIMIFGATWSFGANGPPGSSQRRYSRARYARSPGPLVGASGYAYLWIYETKGLRADQMDRLFGFEREGGGGVESGSETNGKSGETVIQREAV
ncbi:hypothetical protein AJ79_02284 [Helicocarpus griseus UAMH5409]|uniref:Major facilitator superfamily (MFS) profile domain-containing protein n=1 Tax=Helicocarpus griseus UAMH5409 TaxID=1447875 RepID=A0A2B7Y366_9EURO|nr:hypothetical protein AJ79_02284 [Helicocarpus griseus UAMH5409]